MIITTSMSALVLAMITSGAIPTEQAQALTHPVIGIVTSDEQIHTDTPWIDRNALLAVAPVDGYLEALERERQLREAAESCKN